MDWKQLPYWLRGGIIAVIFFIIILVTLILLATNYQQLGITREDGGFLFYLGAFFLILITLPVIPSWGSIANESFIDLIPIVIVGLIFYFMIGEIIGLVIGKIKSKKQSNLKAQ